VTEVGKSVFAGAVVIPTLQEATTRRLPFGLSVVSLQRFPVLCLLSLSWDFRSNVA